MKTEIRPENEMKDSGIEWIKHIPRDWNIVPLKRYFQFGKGLPITKADLKETGEKVISYGQIHAKFNTGVLVDDRLIRFVSSDYKLTNASSLCSKGDIILADTSEDKEGCGNAVYIDCDEKIFAGYHTIILKSDRNNKYLAYLFQSDSWREQIQKRVNGVKLFSITKKILNQCTIILPSLSEQQAIADYLDEVCSQIDEIIVEAKASIEEYKELKQAVIFEAVTKGIDKNVKMKDVNIEYLESCPVDWHILPISMLFDFFGGFAYKSDRFCEKTKNQVVRLGNVKDDELRLNSNPVYVSNEYANASSKAAIKVDDILFTMTGTRGKGDYFYTLIITENDLKDRNLLLNQRVGCFRKAYHTVYMPYYNYLLKSSKIRERVFLYETGTANQGNIGIENINRIRLYNPPMEVQKKIVITLKHKCSEIDSLITEKESLIADLEAYKKSLIYELVTGKRRVV